jgi:hypothetical protein
MMVQNALPGNAHFVSTMAEHNDLCGQFVRAFGNDVFEAPSPRNEMIYVVSHHDYGWNDWDAAPALDPRSRLPAGLAQTPPEVTIDSNTKSPEINERHHPYCGLLASMHSWGLFNARYGFSEFRVRPGGSTSVPIPKGREDEANTFLDGERARQDRLRAALAANPDTRALVEEAHLFKCYKQLQFFDTLALYFNLRHESERGVEVFTHVPKSETEDADVTVTPVGGGTYTVDPFPFAGDRLEVRSAGRYVKPIPEGTEPSRADMGKILSNLPTTAQVFTLVPA